MTHSFTKSALDPNLCAQCKRPEIDHTSIATCESCNAITTCDYYSKVNALWCRSCADSYIKHVKEQRTVIVNDTKEKLAGLRFSGDLFNAQIPAIVHIKNSFRNDESIPEHERMPKFWNEMLFIYETLSKTAFDLEEQQRQVKVAQLAITQEMRTFGDQLSDEISEKFKITDSKYRPIIKKVKPNIKKAEKKSPFDRMVEALALAQGIDKDKARIMIEAGQVPGLSKPSE